MGQAVHPTAIGQQPVVAHPHQSHGQHVQQEAPDEFRGVQRQRLVLTVAVVAIAQAHRIVVQAQDACVADGDAMGVAGQIADQRRGVLQAGLGEDHPLLGHQRIEHGRDLARGDPTGDGDGVSSRMLACYDARTDNHLADSPSKRYSSMFAH